MSAARRRGRHGFRGAQGAGVGGHASGRLGWKVGSDLPDVSEDRVTPADVQPKF